MRSVKSVLTMAASLKQNDKSLSDMTVLIKSLMDNNIPKYVPNDLPIFMAII